MIMNELPYEHYIDSLPEEGDTSLFGLSLAANEKYLAVGDTEANRVIVYCRSPQQEWVRFRAISVPIDLLTVNIRKSRHTIYKLALAEDTLIIGTTTSGVVREQKQQFYLESPSNVFQIHWIGAVYQISLTSDSLLERIDQPKNGELAGFYIAAHGNNIAFGVATHDNPGESSGYITVISNGHRYNFADIGDFSLYKPFALHDNSLVVSSTIRRQQGRVSIFNLAAPDSPPQIVEVPTLIAKIALTEKFIIIAEQLSAKRPNRNSKTTVMSTTDFSIIILDCIGDISACENRLVCSHSGTPDGKEGKLRLFDLSHAPPELIYAGNIDVVNSILTRDLLFTLIYNGANSRFCILSL
jgi:hypothetical protein